MDDEDEFNYPEPREFGCLFGGECCMPGEHFTSECHTAEMMDEYYASIEAESTGGNDG